MDSNWKTKKFVASSLYKDEERIQTLSDTLQKSASLSKDMVRILDSFQGRLTKMDKTIMPVYEKTKQLTHLQENVDVTLTAMNKIIGYHHIADEVEPKLLEGPAGNITGYLKLLDKLREAVDFFKGNNPSSLELSHITSSFDKGIDFLEKDFRDMLRRHSQNMLPAASLEKIVKEEERINRIEEGDDNGDSDTTSKETLKIQHFSDDVVKSLNTIAKYITSNTNNSDILTSYATIRSYAVGRSLKTFMEAGSPKKQSFQNFLQRPLPAKRQTVKRKENMPVRSGGRSGVGKYSSAASILASEGVADEQLEGSSILKNSSIVLLRLLESEYQLMELIVPVQHHKHVFAQLVDSPIDYFIHRGDLVHQCALRQLGRSDFVTIVPLLKIIKQMDSLLPQYGRLLGHLESDIYRRFPNLVSKMEKTTVKAMEDYIVYIKSDSEKYSNLPKDGTVHELTTNTMWFFGQMLKFADTAGRLEVQNGQYSVHEEQEEQIKAVSSYTIRVLDALTFNMETKGRNYESTVLSSLFLMNNYHFIQETFTKNEKMLELLRITLPGIEENYSMLIGNHRRTYLKGFNKLLSFLGIEAISRPLSKNQRQKLKDKFKGFNTELEELYKVQQYYSIPNQNLRQSVRKEASRTVLLAYKPFYEEFSLADFTKNPDKYLKYNCGDVELKLSKFFDSGAD